MEEAAQLQVKLASLKKLLELPDSGAKPIEDRYFSEAQYYLNELATQRAQLQQEMQATKHAAMNGSSWHSLPPMRNLPILLSPGMRKMQRRQQRA
mgnify:CR=1 FL=1